MRALLLLALPALVCAAETYLPADNDRVAVGDCYQLSIRFPVDTCKPDGLNAGAAVSLARLDDPGTPVATWNAASAWPALLSCGTDDVVLLLSLPDGTSLSSGVAYTVSVPTNLLDLNDDGAYNDYAGTAGNNFAWNFTIDDADSTAGPEMVHIGYGSIDEGGTLNLDGGVSESLLQATDRNFSNRSDLLTYTLVVPPVQGVVERETSGGDIVTLQAGNTWTQDDVDAGLIRYRNQSVGIDDFDRIAFTVTSPDDVSSPTINLRTSAVRWMEIQLTSVGSKDFLGDFGSNGKQVVIYEEAPDRLDVDRDGTVDQDSIDIDSDGNGTIDMTLVLEREFVLPGLVGFTYDQVPATKPFATGASVRFAFADEGLASSITDEDRFEIVSDATVTMSGSDVYYNAVKVASIDSGFDGSAGVLQMSIAVDNTAAASTDQAKALVADLLTHVRYFSRSLSLPDTTRNLLVTINDGLGGELVEAVGVQCSVSDNPPRNPRLLTFNDATLWVGGAARAEDSIVVDDPDSTSHIYEVISEPEQGSVSIADDGSFVYRPFLSGEIDDTFEVAIDPDAGQTTLTVAVRITDIDDVHPQLVGDPQMQLLAGDRVLLDINLGGSSAADGLELRLWGDVPDDVGLLPVDAADDAVCETVLDLGGARQALLCLSVDSQLEAEALLRIEGGLMMTALDGDERSVGYVPFNAVIVLPEATSN